MKMILKIDFNFFEFLVEGGTGFLRRVPPMRTIFVHLGFGLGLLGIARPGGAADGPETGEGATPDRGAELRASMYVRTDTDHTTVYSPRARYRQQLGSPQRRLDISYSLDAWSSASIDIRTAATPTVTELRHEADIGYNQEIGLGGVGLGYRLSYEPDYLSNAVRLSGMRDFLQRTITLSGRLFGSFDRVGRAGDRFFRQQVISAGGLASAAFVLSKSTLALFAYELRGVFGYQASPYRYVAIGGGLCAAGSTFCLPEEVPRQRVRHATVGQLRQAIGRRVALGGLYRFYIDSWALRSHTWSFDTSVMLAKGAYLRGSYRGYAQSGASFYRVNYGIDARFLTRDRELSSLGNHRVALRGSYDKRLRRGTLDVGAQVAGSRLQYDEFIGLTHVFALEVSMSLGGRF